MKYGFVTISFTVQMNLNLGLTQKWKRRILRALVNIHDRLEEWTRERANSMILTEWFEQF